MRPLKTLGRIIVVLLLCCFCVCFVLGFFFNLAWHLSVLGLWGSSALIGGLICIAFLLRKRLNRIAK